MRWWANRIREWQSPGRGVFAYFNSDRHGHAVCNATALKEFLGV